MSKRGVVGKLVGLICLVCGVVGVAIWSTWSSGPTSDDLLASSGGPSTLVDLPSLRAAGTPFLSNSVGHSHLPRYRASAQPLATVARAVAARARTFTHATAGNGSSVGIARATSRKLYRNLSAAQAAVVANDSHPSVVNQPASPLPPLAAGERILNYPTATSATVALSGGRHAVLSSTTPLSVATPSGARRPIDLSVHPAGHSFAPAVALVPISIPRSVSSGVRIVNSDITITPVDVQGAPLRGAQGVDLSGSVLYANTQTDADTVIKPLPVGVAADTLLRSPDSPERLAFKLGLADGARLVRSSRQPGAAEVLRKGKMLALIPAASATDAEGAAVPVSMTAAGDELVLTIDHRAGNWRYPIDVDPTVADSSAFSSSPGPWVGETPWPAHPPTGGGWWLDWWHGELPYSPAGLEISDYGGASVPAGQWANWQYHTQGTSEIYALYTVTTGSDRAGSMITDAYLAHGGTLQAQAVTPNSSPSEYGMYTCLLSGCAVPSKVEAPANTAVWQESATTEDSFFDYRLGSAVVYIDQESGPSGVERDKTDPTLGGAVNAFDSPHGWVTGNAVVGFNAFDPGIGIYSYAISSPGHSGWEGAVSYAPDQDGQCQGVECPEAWTFYTSVANLPDGIDEVQASAKNATGASNSTAAVVEVDNTAPTITLAGSLNAANNKTIGEHTYELNSYFQDGSGTTVSSGIEVASVAVDGRNVWSSSVGCTPGPCASSDSYSFNAANFGEGTHVITASVRDYAGNSASKQIVIKVNNSASTGLGPGTVNLSTGEFALDATDVSMTNPSGELTLGRGYSSEHLASGASSPLGPQWKLDLPTAPFESLNSYDEGLFMTAIDSSGRETYFYSLGGGKYSGPQGSSGVTLKVSGGTATLTDSAGDVTTFTEEAENYGLGRYVLSNYQVTGGGGAITYKLEPHLGSPRPSEIIAPAPVGVSCSASLVKGCRALIFTYASSTTATSESPSGWGDYAGRLKTVGITAWSPTGEKMTTTTVAQYQYDSAGKLRSEWDPRISPALKSTYGYDTGGRITALSSAGQQPWLIAYTQLPGDQSAGRVATVSRPGASTALFSGPAPANTAAPTLSSTTPAIGTTLSVSGNGTWSNSPLAYSYQWERCAPGGGSCTAITGATNQSYTPRSGDAGYALVAQVTAVNSNGSVFASTAASSAVPSAAPSYASAFGSGGSESGKFNNPARVATDPSGNLWVTDNVNNRIEKFSASGSFLASYGSAGSGNGQFLGPNGIAIDQGTGNVYVSDEGNNRIQELSSSGTFVRAFGSVGALPGYMNRPAGITLDPNGHLWVADKENNRVQEFTSEGVYMLNFGLYGSGNGQFITPTDVALTGGNVYVTDAGNNRVEEFSSSGAYIGQFGSSGSGNGQFSGPRGIATDPTSGDLFVVDKSNSRVQDFNPAGTYLTKFASVGSGAGQLKEPTGVTVTSSGTAYVVDSANNRVERWNPTNSTNNPQPSAPTPGATAVTTVTYHVPVSGAGAPDAMGSSEVASWGQSDDPVEATAIFAPDEPVANPAADYRRATIYYLDEPGLNVNTAEPGARIATSEYNSNLRLIRTLTPANRHTALEAGSSSAAESQQLDTEMTYNSEGTEMLTELGPRHTVKLSSGTQVQARKHVQYSYDEGAPSGGPYDLVTKATAGAQISEQPEADVRSTTYSYSGQENLGWTLRKPTTVTTDAGTGRMNLVTSTVYDPATGQILESRMPGALALPSLLFGSQFGAAGSGSGQFSSPYGVAVDGSGNVWVADSGNNRIEKFSSSGSFVAAYGSLGSGNGQFSGPGGVAVNPATGNVYVSDHGNNRVEELSSAGTFIRAFGSSGSGNGQFNLPAGITVDGSGNVWVADYNNNRIQKFSAEGTFIAAYGSVGSGNGQFSHPANVTFSGEHLYVADSGNNRVQELSLTGTYVAKFGSAGSGNGQFSEPEGVATDPVSGDIYVSDGGNNRVEEFTAGGTYLGMIGEGRMSQPVGLAFTTSGTLVVGNVSGNDIQLWVPKSPRIGFGSQFGAAGSGSGQFSSPYGVAVDGSGNVWVADSGNNRIEKFSSSGSFVAAYGSLGSGNGQFSGPGGVAVNPATGNVYVSDHGNNRVEELSSAGTFIRAFGSSGSGNGQFNLPAGITVDGSGNVWVADYNNNRIQKFSAEGTFIAAYGSVGSGNGQFSHPANVTFSGEHLYVADSGNNRVQELSLTGTYVAKFGSAGSGNGQFSEPEGVATDPVSGDIYVSDGGNSRVEVFTAGGTYLGTIGSHGSGEGQMSEPVGLAFSTSGTLYVGDVTNNEIQLWVPKLAGSREAHTTRTVLYTTAANSTVPACGNHAEWAGLPCQTEPGAQPGTGGLPVLPVTKFTSYNTWDQILHSSEASGSATRNSTLSYDEAGRPLTTAVTSSLGGSLPTVTDEYDSSLGVLKAQKATIEGKAQSVSSTYNTLGELGSYADADGGTASYTYDIDGRMETANDGKGTQTFTYDATTGQLSSLKDSAAGTFTASYNDSGMVTTVGYPNGMNATYTYNSLGQPTELSYVKTTHCSSGCTWFSDAVVPTIRDQWATQTSSLSSQNYTYDNDGRLTQVQDTPVGQGCTTRVYAYDADSNRVGLTTRSPGSGGSCASEGGSTEVHSYDSADRLMDGGIAYDAFGNTTALPAADAGGHALTSTYYADNTLASQTQNGQTISYRLDPAGRARETVSTGGTSSTVISHFASSDDAPSWIVDSAGNWTRSIGGINGLAATQTNGETPVLQLVNLHGDVIATAALSETATGLLSSNDSTEFGVPRGSSSPKYAYLGGEQRATELSSGVVSMGSRTYVPQLGRFEQPDPIEGGSANSYDYSAQDPVNNSDVDGDAFTMPYEAVPDPTVSVAASFVAAQSVLLYTISQGAAMAGMPGDYQTWLVAMYEDPTVMLTVKQAKIVIRELHAGVTALLLARGIPGAIGDIVAILVEAGGADVISMMETGLSNCVEELGGTATSPDYKYDRCKVYLKLPWLKWGVEMCFGVPHRRGVKYYCSPVSVHSKD
jgi:RHS repeat-associated protein